MKKHKYKTWFLSAILVLLVTACIFSLLHSRYGLVVTRYAVAIDGLTQPVRMVHLSDLHCMEFGSENEKLVALVSKQEPDIIAMTGDMISRDSNTEDVQALCELVSAMAEIAPVYFSLGNHELMYMETHGDALLAQLEDAGAVILEQEFQDITVAGQPLRIGGAYGYLLSRKYKNTPEQDFMDAFTDTEMPTVLLSHLSEGLLAYHCLGDWNVDLVLSGHTHGGQVRLPLLGGLYDPEVGFFPKYTQGLFQNNGAYLVLSAGLGSSTRIPRFNNPPELIVIDLMVA